MNEIKLKELEDNKGHCQECGGSHFFINKYNHEEVQEYLWFVIICDNCATIHSTFTFYKDQVYLRSEDYE